MFDTRPALADMAHQIRACRSGEGLTLQQLASRSGVAASTIHKVESQQMVPTVSVLLKIAKGLGRRPEELIRDAALNDLPANASGSALESPLQGARLTQARPNPNSGSTAGEAFESETPRVNGPKDQGASPFRAGIWRLGLSQDCPLPTVALDSVQRAIILVEQGAVELRAGKRRVQMSAGDCFEVEGGESIEAVGDQRNPACLTLIVSPPGRLEQDLGAPDGLRPNPG